MKMMIIHIYEGPTWFHAPCRVLSCGLAYLLLSDMKESYVWKHSDLNFFEVIDVNLSPCSAPHWVGDLDLVRLTTQSLGFLFYEMRQKWPPHHIVAGVRWETVHEAALPTIKCNMHTSGYYLASSTAYQSLWRNFKKSLEIKQKCVINQSSCLHTGWPCNGHLLAEMQPRVVNERDSQVPTCKSCLCYFLAAWPQVSS